MPIARVLIVANDRPTVTFVEGVVSSLGCTYDMALNLRQAEDLALASPVDLLITGATTSVSVGEMQGRANSRGNDPSTDSVHAVATALDPGAATALRVQISSRLKLA